MPDSHFRWTSTLFQGVLMGRSILFFGFFVLILSPRAWSDNSHGETPEAPGILRRVMARTGRTDLITQRVHYHFSDYYRGSPTETVRVHASELLEPTLDSAKLMAELVAKGGKVNLERMTALRVSAREELAKLAEKEPTQGLFRSIQERSDARQAADLALYLTKLSWAMEEMVSLLQNQITFAPPNSYEKDFRSAFRNQYELLRRQAGLTIADK